MEENTLNVRTRMEREAEELLRGEGATPGQAIPVSKVKNEKDVGEYEVETNIHGIKLGKKVVVYRYDLSITGETRLGKTVELTKRRVGDSISVDYREFCREIFFAFVKFNRAFVQDVASIFYDLQSILYSLNRLDVPLDSGRKFPIQVDSLQKSLSFLTTCTVEIRYVRNGDFTLGDITTCVNKDLDVADHSLLQFLDLATSQHVLFSPRTNVSFSATKNFLLNPEKHGFNETTFFHDNGAYLAIGCQKSVRILEGPSGNGSTALIIEAKKTPFHAVENLYEKICRLAPSLQRGEQLHNGDRVKVDKFCSGLRVETRHRDRSQQFDIKGLDSESAASRIINVDGQDMSIQEYFKQRYQLVLLHPNIPLVRMRGANNQTSYIPMELCEVMDNQRVKTHQQTAKQVQETIKKCAIAPTAFLDQTQKIFESMEFASSEYLKNAEINILGSNVRVKGKLLPAPEMEYAGNKFSPFNLDRGTWQSRSFLIPGSCLNWVAYAFIGGRDRLSEGDFHKFLARYIDEGRRNGMRMNDPADIQIFSSCNVKDVEYNIKMASQNHCTFALVIHPDAADDIHNNLKLVERNFSIVTQAIRFSTLNNMIERGQPLTLQNIVNKTNVKLGGLNYTLSINSPGARDVIGNNNLFIGIGMNHPGGRSGSGGDMYGEDTIRADRNPPPSVVGYCANVGLKDNFEFVGDFYYQPPMRDEKTSVIRTIVKRCVDMYRSNRRADPICIILYRNGCSEGNFSMVLRLEVPLIKTTLESMNCASKLIVLVPNKMQNIRFVPTNADPKARASDQNIKSGFLLDHSVAHPVLTDFFLNSHRALQGTARTPKYTLLVNESDYDLKKIENFTYALCFGHQIVTMPTSLPSPVYIALRYAERGRKLYNVWLAASEGDRSKLSYEEATEQLGYYTNTDLSTRRINA